MGPEWHDNDLVFTSQSGLPLDGKNVTKAFQRMLRRAGLPKRRFYDLRHSCATLLLVQGVPARVVMEILGHSQIGLTITSEQITAFCAVSGDRKQTTYALVSWRVARHSGQTSILLDRQ